MYQLEVKYHLIRHQFPPAKGWEVVVDIDAMEQAKGHQHAKDKKAKVANAEDALRQIGVKLGAHPQYGRVDVVASHSHQGSYLIEVEGQSSKQTEQAMYSAIGQIILTMAPPTNGIAYGIAVPDLPQWERQINKIPARVKSLLNLKCYLVSVDGVRES